MQEMWTAPPGFRPTKSAPCSPAKPLGVSRSRSESFHVAHKVPVGDSPYVRAKNVQLVDKDPERAIPLFWAAINSGDRVDSALKDMAIVMKQQNRSEEAIEAIKSLRIRCSDQSQESLDNILLDLYKRCGRLDDQIGLLRRKLFLIQQGMAFNGKRTKTARSQGKKFQVSVEQEATRLLGNLGWALMQQNNYTEAEDAYRRALVIAPDSNKMCNLGICLMKQGRITEAKETLRRVKPPAVADGQRGVDSHLKAYERAQQMLRDLESEMMNKGGDRVEQCKLFNAFLGSSAIWQPQPCRELNVAPNPSLVPAKPLKDDFADENVNLNNNIPSQPNLQGLGKPIVPFGNSLNIAAQPFFSSKCVAPQPPPATMTDRLKRTRSANADGTANLNLTVGNKFGQSWKPPIMETKSQPNSPKGDKWKELALPDNKDFEDAILAAVLGSLDDEPESKLVMKTGNGQVGKVQLKVEKKRLKVFQQIAPSLSPRT
ncbi:Tetratricopeptide TPR-1 [Heracleum sosnowskyi]|uniref:Tetratricopeptide TPR-1 n=1 Tax=Heracleum sosnowskyi TaxID=360622 RepID=A0AAD8MY95_9APIA|nr:Tetratricopeptide TPR-1 [Heracleum sosnowskyi]